MYDALGGTQYDRAFQATPSASGEGSRGSLSLAMIPLAEIRFTNRGSHGCERQIRLRRADPSLGSLTRPGQVAATARNLRAGGTDCGLLVQRRLWRIRRPLPAQLRGRTAFQTSDFFPSVVRLAGERALAETNIVILVRAAIYERDWLDPVEPSEAFDKLFAASDLSTYPEAYRYMAARLNAAGRALAPVVHCDGSPHTAQLYARYEAW